MRQVIARVQRLFDTLQETGKDRLRGLRSRSASFDHMARAYERYQDRRGDRLAAALTCYGFLSFFPLLALAYALLGYLVKFSDKARDYFVEAVNSLLPGLSDQLQLEQIVSSKTAVGVIGLVGLLFTGLGWVSVLRESLRDIWGNDPIGDTNFILKKVYDAAVLIFLGLTLILSVAVSTIASRATHTVLGWLELDDVTGAGTALRLLSLAIAIVFNTLIFVVLFSRLSGTSAPWRRIIKGALFGALGFEVLKQVASLLLSRTTENPVYASFAVLVGLMVWINITSRFMLFVAAWTATRSVVLHADDHEPEKPDPDDDTDKPGPDEGPEKAGADGGPDKPAGKPEKRQEQGQAA